MSDKTILVVEDNPITRKMIAYTLSVEGYEVVEAGDGRTALAHAGRQPDLFLLDYVLPDMDGLQLLAALRARPGGADVPAAVITGMVSHLAEMRTSGADPTTFLPKPIEPERLLEFVRGHLDEHSSAIGAGRRVLVVDDEPMSRKLTAMYLEEAGFRVETTAGAAEALEKAGRAPPDAILSDVLMPGMDGFLLSRAIRSDPRLAGVPVVLLSSAYVEAPDQKLAHEMGASALLPRGTDQVAAIQALADAMRTGVTPDIATAGDLSAVHLDRVRAQLEKQMARNETLLRQSAIQAAALSVVRGLAEALARPDDLPAMLADVLVHCLDAAGLSSGALYLPLPDGQLRLQAQAGLAGAAREDASTCFGHPEVLRHVQSAGEPAAYRSGDPEASAEVRDFIARVGQQWALIVPFVVQQRNLGALILASDSQDLSNSSWTGFARSLGIQFGQTIALGQYLSRGAATEVRYRALMAGAHDAILILDARLQIIEANRAAGALFGVEGDGGLVGRPYLELVASEERETAVHKHELLVERGVARIEERQMLRADGTRVIVDVSFSLVRFGEEPITIAVLRDITERKRAEKALRASEESLRRSQALLQMASRVAHMGAWALDLSDLTLTWSDEVRVIHEVPPDYVPNLEEGINFYASEYRDTFREAFGNCSRDGTPWDLELQIITAKGRRVWVRAIGEAERDVSGAVRRVHGAFQDISGPKRAAEEARVVAERLANTLETITDAFFIMDRDRCFTYVNPQAERILHRSRGELLGRVISEAFPEALGSAFHREYERAMAEKVPVDFEEFFYTSLGGWFEGRAYPSEAGLAVYFRDVSEKHQAREALQESEKRYRLLFDATPHPMWVFDPETLAFLEVNDAAVRLYGYSRDEFLGMTIKDIRPPEDVPRLLETLADRDQHARADGVWRHRRKDGSLLDVEIASNAILHRGKPARLVLATDVSEKRRLELQLLQSQKMEAVGQLAGGVAHDFNNLLGVITGYSELLRKDLEPGHRGARRLEEIKKAADRAAALTRQLLAFSRKQVLQPRVLDLNHVVSDTEKMLRRLIGEDIQFDTVFGSALGRVRVDPGQMEQIIVNLAVNARDAMPKGGRLVIETCNTVLDETYTRDRPGVAPGEYVLLAVSDTGHGMDPATTAKIFEPFFTTKEPGKGTGLGLATVYGIVKQSAGHIAVYSEPGRGTTFKVYFPRVEADLEQPIAAPVLPPPRGTETVLLLEDAEALRMIVREILEDAGYRVVDGTTTEEALALAARHEGPIHVVLTDVVMPRASGPEIVAQLEALRPQIRVLFMSGYTDQAIGQHGVLDPGTHFIQKPFTADALQRKMREVLDAPNP